MPDTIAVYYKGAALPDLACLWLDDDGNPIDFTTGYTFEALIGTPGTPALFTKTDGFTGADTDPNLTLAWPTTGELQDLAPNKSYSIDITATRQSDGKPRKARYMIFLSDAVAAETP